MITKQRWIMVFMLALVVVLVAGDAWSIPVFARKYKTTCVTCHEAFPRLNAVGEAYRLNGYKFADDELYIKDVPVEQGDEAYKKVWPDAIWPGSIPGLPPIAFRMLSDFIVDLGGTEESKTKFDFPHETEILIGGAIGDAISFFWEIEVEGDETSAVGWAQFEDLGSADNIFNIKVGTMGMGQEFGLFTARDGMRLTKNHYLYGNWRIPYPGDFEAGNRYRLRSSQPGVELNGFGRALHYAVGVVEGDSDLSDKDYYAQIVFKVGGLGFDGSGAIEKEGELPSPGAETWLDDSVMFSIFAYFGKANVTAMEEGAESEDEFWRFGPSVQWKSGNLKLGGGYIFGENDDPYGTLSSKKVDSDAWFLEAEYWLYPWLVPYVRYETLELDLPAGLEGLDSTQDRANVVTGAKILFRTNVSVNVEGLFHTNDETKENDDDGNKLFVRLDVAL